MKRIILALAVSCLAHGAEAQTTTATTPDGKQTTINLRLLCQTRNHPACPAPQAPPQQQSAPTQPLAGAVVPSQPQ
jgi:hypothetical protein